MPIGQDLKCDIFVKGGVYLSKLIEWRGIQIMEQLFRPFLVDARAFARQGV